MQWLAGLNPDWNFAADDSPEHWETGGREQRLAILRGWRTSQPADAREKMAAVWSTEPADVRSAFLGTLAEGLSDEDAAFLERALDDRSKDVRRLAATLLARLPNSPFVTRMVERSVPLLAFHKGGLLTRSSLNVKLPDEPDASARRDGLDPKDLETPRTMGGEKAGLLAHIVGAVPLRRWTEAFQQTPESLLKAAERHDFAAAITSGWALAAVRQRDCAWAGALLDGGKDRQARVHLVRTLGLFDVLPEAERADRLLAAIRAEPFQAAAASTVSWHGLFTHFSAKREYLPEEMAAKLLADLRRVAAIDAALPVHYVRHFAEALAIKVPLGLLPEAIQNWPGEKDWVARLVELLTFRRDALAALAQP